jgi:hypothetical protein
VLNLLKPLLFSLGDCTVTIVVFFSEVTVPDPERGVCADPVGKDATLGVGGPGPPGGASERQLSPDRGGGKT